MISLSDDELAAVTAAAQPIPPQDRDSFLRRALSLALSPRCRRQHLNPPSFHGNGGDGKYRWSLVLSQTAQRHVADARFRGAVFPRYRCAHWR
jgi:hypothetical protein